MTNSFPYICSHYRESNGGCEPTRDGFSANREDGFAINHLVDASNFFTSDWRVSTFIIWRSTRESFTTQVVSYIAIDLSIFIRYKKERLIVRFWDDFRNLFGLRLIPISLPSWEENAPRTLPVNN
jgi:hypothetical protein